MSPSPSLVDNTNRLPPDGHLRDASLWVYLRSKVLCTFARELLEMAAEGPRGCMGFWLIVRVGILR